MSLPIIQNIIADFLFKIGNNDLRIKISRKKGVKIGNRCKIFNVNFGSEPYLISIGDHCEITGNVTFITHDGGTWVFRENRKYLGSKFGPIKIHDNCFIGMNSIIFPNVEIGPNSVVGAGSVVTKKVKANSVYAGNPAKYICSIDEYLYKCMNNNTGDTGLNDHRSENQKDILIKKFRNFFN